MLHNVALLIHTFPHDICFHLQTHLAVSQLSGAVSDLWPPPSKRPRAVNPTAKQRKECKVPL